jgi:hypothetical protein
LKHIVHELFIHRHRSLTDSPTRPSTLAHVIVSKLSAQESLLQKLVTKTPGNFYERPILALFCKELTGIQQTDVDDAPELPDVLLSFDAWLESSGVDGTRKNRLAPPTTVNWFDR